MSKRMHIYAAAIDPLRKKFGISARAVADKVTEILSHNGKLTVDVANYKAEVSALKSAADVYKASHDAVHTELATAQEQIATLQAKLAAAMSPPAVAIEPQASLSA